MSENKPTPETESTEAEQVVNGLHVGDTAEVIADLGKKYEGLRGEVTLLDPSVQGVVLLADGVREFFLGTDLKKV